MSLESGRREAELAAQAREITVDSPDAEFLRARVTRRAWLDALNVIVVVAGLVYLGAVYWTNLAQWLGVR